MNVLDILFDLCDNLLSHIQKLEDHHEQFGGLPRGAMSKTAIRMEYNTGYPQLS